MVSHLDLHHLLTVKAMVSHLNFHCLQKFHLCVTLGINELRAIFSGLKRENVSN